MFNNGLKDGTRIYIKEAETGAYGANCKYGIVTNDMSGVINGRLLDASSIDSAFLVELKDGSVWNIGTQAEYCIAYANETKISSTIYNGSTSYVSGYSITYPNTSACITTSAMYANTIGKTSTIAKPTINLAIKRVIHNDPATIVYWENGDRTVVKANDEKYDGEKGLAMAIIKYMTGNTGKYFNIFKKYCPEVENE